MSNADPWQARSRERFTPVIATLAILTAPIPRAAAEEIVLENASVRIALRDGGIASLRDKARSLEHAATGPAQSPGFFHIQWVKGTQPAGGDEKRYLFPTFEGRILPLRQSPLWRSYPAEVFAQITACLGQGGGFLLWTDDGEGHVKAFGFDRRDGTAIRDRKDMPGLLLHPPLCLSTQLTRENVDTLPDRLAAWAKRFNAPVIYRPLGWEKYGNWVGIDYFPPALGEIPFRDLAARLRTRDIAMAGFISGYRWTAGGKSFDTKLDPEATAALGRFFKENDGAWRATFYTGATPDGSRQIDSGATLEWQLQPGRLGAIVSQSAE